MRTATRCASALATAALILPLATGCFLPPSGGGTITELPLGEITRAEASQSQAIPDFDTSVFLIEEADELDRLEALLLDARIQGDYRSTGESCPGSITTDVVVVGTSTNLAIRIASCEPSEFEAAVTDLVTEWRSSGAFPAAP